jgi:hypothetical protein
MGVQLSNVLTGNTGGTIITVDYTQDFVTLNTNLANITGELTFIDANITTLNGNIGTLTAAINTSIGVAGQTLPGSSSNSAMLAKDTLTYIAEILASMQQNQNDLTQSLGHIQFSISGVGSAMQEAVATQQLAAADQMSTNEFNKTATKEALARNGIEAPAPRPITAVIQEKVQEATTINATASVTGFIDDKLTTGLTYTGRVAVDYVSSTAAAGWIASKWTATKQWFGFKSAEVQRIATVNTAMATARTGAKTAAPPAPPPTPT